MQKDTFAERLRLAREKKGMGLKELREAVGVSQSAMSHYSTGATLPPLDVAVKIAETLGVSLNWLCGKSAFASPTTTYGQVVRLLMKIGVVLPSDRLGDFIKIAIIDQTISGFFMKKVRFEEMSKTDDDTKELYEAWLSATLHTLDEKPMAL